jgi:hypothetical protein
VTGIEKLYDEALPTKSAKDPVIAQSYGIKEFFIRDRSQNLIVFAELREADTASDKG